MNFNFEMVLQIVIQAVSITAIIVTVKCNQRFFEEKLNNLEKKQDKLDNRHSFGRISVCPVLESRSRCLF